MTGKDILSRNREFEDFTSFDELMYCLEATGKVSTQRHPLKSTPQLTWHWKNLFPISSVPHLSMTASLVVRQSRREDRSMTFISGLQVGIANLGNSMAAIKKLVFEENMISKKVLMQIPEEQF